MDYIEALEYITKKDNFYIDLGLDRIKKTLELLGNPQDKLSFIHVAGTNGKGSVCAMLASILQEAGYKTGLYTSPHIWNYTERIQINGIEISKQDFAALCERISKLNIHLTEFEILTVIMFLYFYENNVEIVVLETGLGGRLDATNVIKTNKCAIITQIDLDHTDRLGKTKDEIAYEKAGIIKQNCPIITAMGYEAIRDKADEMDSMLIMSTPFVNPTFIEAMPLRGLHQIENLSLVINALNYLYKNISDEVIINGLKKVKHPCRFEYIKKYNLIIDACHNPNGAMALKNNLDTYYPNIPRRFIFGAIQTKDYKKMMEILFGDNDEIYLYEFDDSRSCSYIELEKHCPYSCSQYTQKEVIINNKLNIICGSFYMINKILSKNLVINN